MMIKTAILAVMTCVFCAKMTADMHELPPTSTAPMGQTFVEPQAEGSIRVLFVGAGGSHHYPRDFLGTDPETVRASGGVDTAATPNLDEALALLGKADVLVFSGNHDYFGEDRFQDAIRAHAAAGKGIVLLHAAVWMHPWEGYNKRFVGGGSRGHGFGDVVVTVEDSEHPVMRGVPATFTITDESYHHEFREDAKVDVLAENGPDDQTKRPHSSVWVVEDPKARIVCMTLGHDERAHQHPAYQAILTNAVKWVAEGL